MEQRIGPIARHRSPRGAGHPQLYPPSDVGARAARLGSCGDGWRSAGFTDGRWWRQPGVTSSAVWRINTTAPFHLRSPACLPWANPLQVIDADV